MLEMVRLPDPEQVLKSYTYELSGGMRQRVMIAMAMICWPKLLIADEPTTALDVTVQAQILQLLRKIHAEANTSILFISHDLNVVKEICQKVIVMYQGKIEQSAPPTQMYTQPVSKFAATFIGHYNVLPMEVFKKLTGRDEDAKDVAFRPEVVEISTEPVEKEGYLSMKGKVLVSLPHGNVLRYAVMCGENQVDVDVLFKKATLIENNTEVCLSFKEEDCIFL